MIKVLIVDDDFLVRMYLNQIIDWKSHNFELIGDANNGEKALDLIKTCRPDIVITDMGMPVMDGIELIQNIKQLDDSIKIIVLSCHDEFDFVKTALKEGADEYLLKNLINPEMFLEQIRKVSQKIDKTDNGEIVKIGRMAVKKQIFEDILSDKFVSDINNGDFAVKLNHVGVIYISISNYHIKTSGFSVAERQVISDNIIKICQNAMTGIFEIIKISEEEFIILGYGKLFEISNKMSIYLEQYLSLNVLIGVCEEKHHVNAVKYTYDKAKLAILNAFYFDKRKIFAENQYMPFIYDAPNILFDIDKFYLEGSAYIDMVIDAFKLYKENNAYPKILIDSYEEIRDIFSLNEINSFDEIIEELQQITKKEVLKSEYSEVVQKACSFIKLNFKNQISLSDVSENCSVNTSYLSHIFKKETQSGFSEYLMNIRIEYSKTLIKEGKIKTRELAFKCGFTDPSYFNRCFKKAVGLSVSDYKKSL